MSTVHSNNDLTIIDEAKQDQKELRLTIKRERTNLRKWPQKPYRRVKIDPKSVYALASSMISIASMATILGVDEETLTKRYADVIAQARQKQNHRLASAMYSKALDQGDGRMMIWLSKQHLGYKESWPDSMQPVAININVRDIPL
jgi:hypothetical protein